MAKSDIIAAIVFLIVIIVTPILIAEPMHEDDVKTYEDKKERHYNKYQMKYDRCISQSSEALQTECMRFEKFPPYTLHDEIAFQSFIKDKWDDSNHSKPMSLIASYGFSIVFGLVFGIVATVIVYFIIDVLEHLQPKIGERWEKWKTNRSKHVKTNEKWQEAIESEIEELDRKYKDLHLELRNISLYRKCNH